MDSPNPKLGHGGKWLSKESPWVYMGMGSHGTPHGKSMTIKSSIEMDFIILLKRSIVFNGIAMAFISEPMVSMAEPCEDINSR